MADSESTAVTLTTRNGKSFIIDADDLEAVSRYAWHWRSGYPCTALGKEPSTRRVTLHHFLLGRAPVGMEWDHRNRIKADNRRSNLRAVTDLVNSHNQGPHRDNKSGVRGVHWDQSRKRWRAYLAVAGQSVCLGDFMHFEDAVRARQDGEVEWWGDVR